MSTVSTQDPQLQTALQNWTLAKKVRPTKDMFEH